MIRQFVHRFSSTIFLLTSRTLDCFSHLDDFLAFNIEWTQEQVESLMRVLAARLPQFLAKRHLTVGGRDHFR